MTITNDNTTIRVIRPGGGAPISSIAMVIALAAVVGCGVFAAAMLLMPLASVRSDAGDAKPIEAAMDTAALAASARDALASRGGDAGAVAELGSSYVFLLDRQPRARVVSGNEDDPDNSGGDQIESVPQSAQAQGQTAQPDAGPSEDRAIRVVRVESAEDVGGAIRDSYRELVLRAIHSDRSGELTALIDHSGASDRGAAVRVREGDEFVEPKHKDHLWRVIVIDPDRNRVVVERQERRLAIALFGTGPVDLAPVVIQPRGGSESTTERVRVAEDGTVIVEKRPDEAIAELRAETGAANPGESEITLQDLAELFEAMRELERYAEQERIERERRRRD